MKNEIVAYTIGVIGFERSERHVLRRVVGESEHRQPTFRPFDKGRGGCPHLVMVNADSPSAIEMWNRFRRANAHLASFSPIFVGHNPTDLPCPDPYVLQWPILSTRLFSVLDQAVTEVHGYRPTPAPETVGGLMACEEATDADVETVAAPPGGMAIAQDERPWQYAEGESSRHPAAETAALVVEDSLPARLQMRGGLSSIVSRVDFAETGGRALEMIDTQAYSIIFLDVTLPDEDAYELCARIKKHPLQQQAVVVMLTSSSSSADRVMGSLAGFDNYLVKPIRRAALSEMAVEWARSPSAL